MEHRGPSGKDSGKGISRRDFIKTVGVGSLALSGLHLHPLRAWAAESPRFIWGGPSEFQSMDPHAIYDVTSENLRLNLYDHLYRYLDNPPKIHPWLAESYTVSDDELTWTFKLREGAKFHNGDEVTAEAVKYSMDRLLALGKGASALFKPVIDAEGVKPLDRYTVAFELKEPYAPFLSIMPTFCVVNPKVVEGKAGPWGSEWLSQNEAGSGAYVLEGYTPGVGWKGKRFKDHWMGWEGKHVDRIEFRTIHETASRVMALMKGDIHGCDGYLPVEQIAKLEDAQDIDVYEEQSMRIFLIRMHNQRPPFDDVHVRRAISYAFDYDSFNNEILKGRVARNPGPIPNNMWGSPDDLKGYAFDLEKAKAELAKARVKVDRPLNIHPMTGYSQTDDAALILQAGLRQIGIEVNIIRETWPTLSGKAKDMDTSPDMWIHWVSTYYADPENWIGEMYSSSRWGAWKASSWYKNPKVDDLLARARTVSDRSVREKLYEEASRIVVDDAADIWVYNTKWYGPYRKSVKDLRFCPVGNGQECRWIHLA
jgi:peptide/nickel transport system substrate-binding protein